MFGKDGMANLMKQAQQMQENMEKAKQELGNLEVEGQAGAGLVTITMTCHKVVKRIHIDDSLLGDDKDMLEDLLAAAFNDGVRKAEETSQKKMASFSAGLNLPPGIKLPF